MARGVDLKIPTMNQLMQMGIAIATLFFIVKFMPEQIKTWFRV